MVTVACRLAAMRMVASAVPGRDACFVFDAARFCVLDHPVCGGLSTTVGCRPVTMWDSVLMSKTECTEVPAWPHGTAMGANGQLFAPDGLLGEPSLATAGFEKLSRISERNGIRSGSSHSRETLFRDSENTRLSASRRNTQTVNWSIRSASPGRRDSQERTEDP